MNTTTNERVHYTSNFGYTISADECRTCGRPFLSEESELTQCKRCFQMAKSVKLNADRAPEIFADSIVVSASDALKDRVADTLAETVPVEFLKLLAMRGHKMIALMPGEKAKRPQHDDATCPFEVLNKVLEAVKGSAHLEASALEALEAARNAHDAMLAQVKEIGEVDALAVEDANYAYTEVEYAFESSDPLLYTRTATGHAVRLAMMNDNNIGMIEALQAIQKLRASMLPQSLSLEERVAKASISTNAYVGSPLAYMAEAFMAYQGVNPFCTAQRLFDLSRETYALCEFTLAKLRSSED